MPTVTETDWQGFGPNILYSMAGHVYTLLLEESCWYVGWSSQVKVRIASHFLGNGSEWTELHKPLRVVACIEGDTTLEDLTTIALMAQHGWEKVRGGKWTARDLTCPLPIRHAIMLNHKRRLDESTDESICVKQTKADGENYAHRAIITTEQAKAECPKRGYKVIYASTREQLNDKIDAWRVNPDENMVIP